jgi:hypothetical protein
MVSISALPERTRLFHVGIPKSGTTALQMAASAGRDELLRQGVLYPGLGISQRSAVLSFMGRRWGWDDDGVPGTEHWDRVMAEIEADTTRRVLFGHEFASEAKKKKATEFVEAIGERCHILITLRSIGAILPSAWQQYVKAGVTLSFDDWLTAVVGDPPNRTVTKRFHVRNDQGAVVRRWAKAAGADRVTVIVADARRPRLLLDSVEQLLALAPGTLADQETTGYSANRGMTMPEAELFRAVNERIDGHDVGWDDFERIVREGAQRRVLEQEASSGDRPALPLWAAQRAQELGKQYAEQIAVTGVHVIGELGQLAEPVRTRAPDNDSVETVPIDLAAEALAGALSASTWRGPDFDKQDETSATREAALRRAYVKRRARQYTLRDFVTFAVEFVRVRWRRVRRGFARGRAADLPASETDRGH